MFSLRSLACISIAAACARPVQDDTATVCIVGTALDRLELVARQSCASDHRRATLSCTIDSLPDSVLEIHTKFRDGRDPDAACASPLMAICSTDLLEAGVYSLRFGATEAEITLPGASGVCLEVGDVFCDSDFGGGSSSSAGCDGTAT